MTYKTLVPAYGRDYKTGKAVKEAFEAGKDFLTTAITDGDQLINREDLLTLKPITVNIRFAAERKITQIILK